jgi:hypothetical protein
MFWKNIWFFLKSIWAKFGNHRTSMKNNTTLDTTSIKIFGQEIKVSREIPVNGPPYELTVVIPRAELRLNQKTGSQEVILSSITIAHSPRFEGQSKPAKPLISKATAA